MPEIARQKRKSSVIVSKQRSYNEVIEYLDAHWHIEHNNKDSLIRTKKLHESLGSPGLKMKIILIGGTNGKSLTAAYCNKLLKFEGLSVGTFSSPHFLTYNERMAVDNEIISNKQFAEVVNEVINAAETEKITAHSKELLVVAGLHYFAQKEVDVALLEIDNGGTFHPANICNTAIAAITRVTPEDYILNTATIEEHINDLVGIVKPGAFLVSADQSKTHLQMMEEATKTHGGNWAMPIRKLATLPYPYEQLHGRCAALAERICQLYAEHFLKNEIPATPESLLLKQKGQRGRPTLEQKRKSELNPKKTLDQLWREDITTLPGRFQLLEKEKPTILLDSANNIDAFKNLLLGIRLLHYQKPLKGLAIIVASTQGYMNADEFLKHTRYFFKKTSGELYICPAKEDVPGVSEGKSWDVDLITNGLKSMKTKAQACQSFAQAFELAKKSVDSRDGLVVITGSSAIIHEYWNYKEIKKL